MMITEYNFSWLHDAEEERITRELEFRRVSAERAAEQAAKAAVAAAGAPAPSHAHRRHGRRGRVSAAGGTM